MYSIDIVPLQTAFHSLTEDSSNVFADIEYDMS